MNWRTSAGLTSFDTCCLWQLPYNSRGFANCQALFLKYFNFLQIGKCSHVTFLSPNKKVTKEVGQRGATSKSAPFGNPSRIANRHPKMFRFSGVYREKTCKFLSCKRSKIGTFLNAGWRGGGGIFKGGAFARSAPLNRLLLVLFLAKQEKYIHALPFKRKDTLCSGRRKDSIVPLQRHNRIPRKPLAVLPPPMSMLLL